MKQGWILLLIENAKKMQLFSSRCGTSFIFVILIFSIVVYTIAAKIFPEIADNRILWILLRLFFRFIMGLGYEFIKYAGRHDNFC